MGRRPFRHAKMLPFGVGIAVAALTLIAGCSSDSAVSTISATDPSHTAPVTSASSVGSAWPSPSPAASHRAGGDPSASPSAGSKTGSDAGSEGRAKAAEAGDVSAAVGGPERSTSVGRADFPSAGNTGVQPGTSLKDHSGDLVVTKSGSTVSGYDISGGLTIKADNVTVRNVRVRCAGVDDFCVRLLGTGDTLDHAEVGGGANGATLSSAVGIWAGGDTGSANSTRITSTNVHHTSDGLRVDGSTTVSDSYVHDLSYADGAHSDGSQNTSGGHVVFRHNTFDGATNCTIFLQPSGETPITDVLIDDNLLVGETREGQSTSYLICVDPRVARVSVTDNRFSRTGWLVGPATEDFPWAAWSGNAWLGGGTLSRA